MEQKIKAPELSGSRAKQKASTDLKSCFCSSLDVLAISYSRADLLRFFFFFF